MRYGWLIPLGLLFLALTLAAAGVGWAVVTGVAVPDQDPTPAVQARAARQMRVVDVLMLAGLAAFAAALVAGVLLAARALWGRRQAR